MLWYIIVNKETGCYKLWIQLKFLHKYLLCIGIQSLVNILFINLCGVTHRMKNILLYCGSWNYAIKKLSFTTRNHQKPTTICSFLAADPLGMIGEKDSINWTWSHGDHIGIYNHPGHMFDRKYLCFFGC